MIEGADGALDVQPLTPMRWMDLVDLFERPGPRGSWPRTSACYCMFWRLPPAEYEASFRQRSLDGAGGGPNKEAMEALVAEGNVPGLLAYRGGRAVGWVSVSPRRELVRLDHVSTLRSEEEPAGEGTWSIACFYVYRSDWRTGVGAALLEAAVAHAVGHEASSMEGYPVLAGSVDPYTGYDTMFSAAGFRLLRPARGKGRALWRRDLSG